MSKTPSRRPAKTVVASHSPSINPGHLVAETDQKTAAFLREVDEAMRIERWQNLWRKGKWPLFGGVAALVAATAAWQGWQSWQDYQDRGTATRWAELAQLPSEADLTAALPQFVAESSHGYKALGLLAEAAQATTPAAKVEAYRALQNDATQPDWLRAIGQLNAALVLLGSAPAEARAELDLLAKTELGLTPLPTVPMALELLALEAMQRTDTAAARAYTERLLKLPEVGGTLSPAMRTRALERLGALGGLQ